MATPVTVPSLGEEDAPAVLIRFLVEPGQAVHRGDPLYELDTDKVTQEVEAEADGVLLKIIVDSGEVEVGKTIAVIGEQGEEVAAEAEKPSGDGDGAQALGDDAQEEGSPARAREQDREQGRRASSELSEQVTEIRQPSADNGGRIKASPLARRIARERGIDLSAVAGTGPDGRVVAEDVERSAASAGPAQLTAPSAYEGVEVQQLSSMRKTIARRLTEAWQAPVFQLGITVDMGRALELRKRLVELNADGNVKPTISDLLTKVCASALIRHRAVNALYKGDAVELYPTANIGIAVAVPNGLVVPVIPGCERKSIVEIAATRSAVVERARAGKLQQSDLDGGTFTISNLGMFGIERFVAVLNPPQAAILAVGSIEDRVVPVDGLPAVRPRMELTLTCDHRAIDGATGAEFLRDVKAFLEEPGLAL